MSYLRGLSVLYQLDSIKVIKADLAHLKQRSQELWGTLDRLLQHANTLQTEVDKRVELQLRSSAGAFR